MFGVGGYAGVYVAEEDIRWMQYLIDPEYIHQRTPVSPPAQPLPIYNPINHTIPIQRNTPQLLTSPDQLLDILQILHNTDLIYPGTIRALFRLRLRFGGYEVEAGGCWRDCGLWALVGCVGVGLFCGDEEMVVGGGG